MASVAVKQHLTGLHLSFHTAPEHECCLCCGYKSYTITQGSTVVSVDVKHHIYLQDSTVVSVDVKHHVYLQGSTSSFIQLLCSDRMLPVLWV